jgi:hypothetical protein
LTTVSLYLVARTAFFTKPPIRLLPHPRIGLRRVLVAHAALVRAFELLREEGYPLASALENDITERLEDKLENRLRHTGEVPGFDYLHFGRVTRANELPNYDRTKKSKKPDLVIGLRREGRLDILQTHDALFAECKPVDKAHRLASAYCALDRDCTGIERFIIGDYAWTMEEALMIGFVRGYRIKPHLAAALQSSTCHEKLGFPSKVRSVPGSKPSEKSEALHITKHQRRFNWVNRRATPINLYHSWHDCS